MLKHPENMNWGMNEIALVKLTLDVETEQLRSWIQTSNVFLGRRPADGLIFVNLEALTLDF